MKMHMCAGMIAFLLGTTNVVQAAISPIQVKSEQGRVEFLAIGKPSFLKIKGEAKGPKGQIAEVDGKWQADFSFELAKLDTGIALRDSHMKDKYLQVGEHPEAKLQVRNLNMPAGFKLGQSLTKPIEVPFDAELEMHGKKNPVKGTLILTSTGAAGTDAKAKFSVKLSDYAIDIPKYAGVSVADSVDIEVGLQNLK